jgi:hypothetical protein
MTVQTDPEGFWKNTRVRWENGGLIPSCSTYPGSTQIDLVPLFCILNGSSRSCQSGAPGGSHETA